MVFFKFLTKLGREDSGATAIEYGLILSMIVIGMLTAFNSVGSTTIGMWNEVSARVVNAVEN
ncbi:Flp family type IVb pilin [Allopontixanthobacter confluentis]